MSQYWNGLNEKNWRLVLGALVLVLVLMSLAPAAQAAGRSGEVVARVEVPQQIVDIDGDGRLENFATEIEVYADGSARGEMPYKNFKFIVVWDGGVESTSTGDVIVFEGIQYERRADGVHEVGHILGLMHHHSRGGIIDFEIVDTATGETDSFQAVGSIEIAQ